MADALWKHDAELCQLTTQHVDRLGALPNHKVPGPVQRKDGLLIWCLHLHKPHRRACHGLANGLRISGIGLAAFDVGFHIDRRDQLDVMAGLEKFPCPVVACATGLHPNEAWLKAFKKRQHLRPPEGAIERNLAAIGDTVNLKNVLRQIKADCCNLHWVAPLLSSS
jgi:hypothetical protein